MNNVTRRSTLLAVAISAICGSAALAETTVTTTTETSGMWAPVQSTGRFFRNVVTAPFLVFRGSSGAQEVVRTTTIGTEPAFVQIDLQGRPTIIKSTVAYAPVSTVTVITTIKPVIHDQFINRRNDLTARVAVEQARGQLSSGEASDFMGRLDSLEQSRVALRKNEAAGTYLNGERNCDTLSYYKEVKRLNGEFDRVANDMREVSNQDDRQLAATYSYIAL